jgi:hypothetical protein
MVWIDHLASDGKMKLRHLTFTIYTLYTHDDERMVFAHLATILSMCLLWYARVRVAHFEC